MALLAAKLAVTAAIFVRCITAARRGGRGGADDVDLWQGAGVTHPCLPGGAATCSEGFVKCFLRVPRLLCCTAAAMLPKQARVLMENMKQNLSDKLPPQTVLNIKVSRL